MATEDQITIFWLTGDPGPFESASSLFACLIFAKWFPEFLFILSICSLILNILSFISVAMFFIPLASWFIFPNFELYNHNVLLVKMRVFPDGISIDACDEWASSILHAPGLN